MENTKSPSPEVLHKMWEIIEEAYKQSPEYEKIDILEWLIINVKKPK